MTSDAAIYIFVLSGAYLLGSVPFGIAVARLFGGVDPRQSGSKNIGATNVGRTVGKAAGLLTLALDTLKGAVVVYLSIRYVNDPLLTALAGGSAFLGHIFPVFLGFKGGKGVATALGVMIILAPYATILSAAIFAIIVAFKRYVSLGSIIAAASLPAFLYLFKPGLYTLALSVFISAIVIIKHKENIKRLVGGTENRI